MAGLHNRSFSPRRAHFSQHASDRPYAGIDQTLSQAEMVDNGNMHKQNHEHPLSESPSGSAGSFTSQYHSAYNPFIDGDLTPVQEAALDDVSLVEGSAGQSHQAPGNHDNAAFSPRETGNVRFDSDVRPNPRRFSLLARDDEDALRYERRQSTRPRSESSPTARQKPQHRITTASIDDKFREDGTATLNSRGLLGNKGPSRTYLAENRPMSFRRPSFQPSSLPRQPAQAHSNRDRVMSDSSSYFSGQSSQPHRSSSASIESIHGSNPHIQHFDPLSSPSMVQPYRPRSCSTTSNKPSLKPTLSRRNSTHDACELGMAGSEKEEMHPGNSHGRFRGSISALVHRVISSDHNADEHDEAGEPRRTQRSRLNTREQPSTEAGRTRERRSNRPYTPIDEESSSEQSSQEERRNLAFILGEDEEPREKDDPRSTGVGRKSADMRRQYEYIENPRSSYSSEYCDQEMKPNPSRLSLRCIVDPLRNFGAEETDRPSDVDTNHRSLMAHMAERQKLILKLARALMLFGAPSHRVESQLNALSQVLGVDGQYIHFPGLVIASFGDIDHHTSECHFVKSKTDLALGHLTEVHGIYKAVITDRMTVFEATNELNRLLKAKPEWSILSRVAFNAIRCGIMAPMSFGGSFIDIFLAGTFGAGLTFTQLYFAGKNPLFSNVFEITSAIVISFLARLLSTKSVFCYQSIASAGLILVLPGYIILCGSLELASKNMIAGSVRMVYAIIYSLFIGFGVAIGSDLYFVVDPESRRSMWLPLNTQTEVDGQFTFANETVPHWSGQFTFTNGTKNALNTGAINCERLPEWPWYRQQVSPFLNILFVPVFSLLACFSLLHPFKSREVPVSVIIACIGYVTNVFAKKYIFDRSDVVSAIGSLTIGLLGNAYSRLYDATAFTAMTVAVLFLVPSGMAMAGGLAMTYKGSDGDLYTNGLSIGMRMVQVSIGITTGLFASALIVYMFGNKRKNAQLFAF